MKWIFNILLFMLPCAVMAQNGSTDAGQLLDNAVATLKADAAVQLDYSYKVYDDDNTIVQDDSGVMRLDGDRYALIMRDLKVWCNGTVQWSYMRDINEIYITDATSGEAQNFSPLSVMEAYRKGYKSSVDYQGNIASVRLVANSPDADVDSIELLISKNNYRPVAMTLFMSGMGRVEVRMTNYSAKCESSASLYECPVADFPSAEVVDMR